MDAMTMNYKVDDSPIFDNVKPGGPLQSQDHGEEYGRVTV
jgi:Cu/Ag efflux protein CusF